MHPTVTRTDPIGASGSCIEAVPHDSTDVLERKNSEPPVTGSMGAIFTPTGLLIIGLAVLAVTFALVASVAAQAHLLRRCFNISLVLGVVLLCFPGLNVIGAILIVIAGAMLLTGRCSLEKKCDRTPRESQEMKIE